MLILLFAPMLNHAQNRIGERVMFYNVENLFDTKDDPDKNDEEFLPNGDRRWTNNRFFLKLNRVSQVIIAAGEGKYPAVVGLAEIENQNVLETLLHSTSLGKLGYQIIHKESPDNRGIDVAFLYQKGLFTPKRYNAIPVINPKDPAFKTRDILYVKGELGKDTIHFFVNHWPSKYGGLGATVPLRALAASILKTYTDSILFCNPESNIVIMGDFNDSPFDESIKDVLAALPPDDSVSNNKLYDLAYPLARKGIGSNKFHSEWDMIDQFIVSGHMLRGSNKITSPESFHVFSPPFLLEDDKTYLGKKPNRTYNGFTYHGGFSDHLPVLLDLNLDN